MTINSLPFENTDLCGENDAVTVPVSIEPIQVPEDQSRLAEWQDEIIDTVTDVNSYPQQDTSDEHNTDTVDTPAMIVNAQEKYPEGSGISIGATGLSNQSCENGQYVIKDGPKSTVSNKTVPTCQPVQISSQDAKIDHFYDLIVQSLAMVHPIRFDIILKDEARRLGAKPDTLERLVKAARKEAAKMNKLRAKTESSVPATTPGGVLPDDHPMRNIHVQNDVEGCDSQLQNCAA